MIQPVVCIFVFKKFVFPCEAWVKNATFRRIVLNKTRQSQVINLHNKSSRYISKECIVLTVEMADDPAGLKVRAGNGKIFKLSLVEGIQPTNHIPKEIDVVPGDFIILSPTWSCVVKFMLCAHVLYIVVLL